MYAPFVCVQPRVWSRAAVRPHARRQISTRPAEKVAPIRYVDSRMCGAGAMDAVFSVKDATVELEVTLRRGVTSAGSRPGQPPCCAKRLSSRYLTDRCVCDGIVTAPVCWRSSLTTELHSCGGRAVNFRIDTVELVRPRKSLPDSDQAVPLQTGLTE